MIPRTLPATQMATFCVELPNAAQEGMPCPTGTGFFISPDGWFVTAAHVITENGESNGPIRSDLDKTWLMKEARIHAGPPGAMCQAVTFGHVFPELDVALLKVDFDANSNKEWLKTRKDFPHVVVSSRELLEGEGVYSFGYPLSSTKVKNLRSATFGFSALCPRVTSAIVSSTIEATRAVMTGSEPQVYVLDKALNYGNSGGPIMSVETGHVHALCSRFQPVYVPQGHINNDGGEELQIMIPSLYGVVARLSDTRILTHLESLGVSITDD